MFEANLADLKLQMTLKAKASLRISGSPIGP